MQIAIGYTVQWRSPNGHVKQMRIELIHEVDGERWLFSALTEAGGFLAVNEKLVKNWLVKPNGRPVPDSAGQYVDMPADVQEFLARLR